MTREVYAWQTERENIVSSAGAQYLNRQRTRSFTMGTFNGNAVDLFERITAIANPERYFETLRAADGSKDEDFRHVARLFHNFVAASMTLVEHTRALINRSYIGTPINRIYHEEVERRFKHNDLTKFVQDLRNYTVHKGMPPLRHTLSGKGLPAEGPNRMSIDIRIQLSRETLLEWDNWTGKSRKFIQDSSLLNNIADLLREYFFEIIDFHQTLDQAMEDYHHDDLRALEAMQEAFDSRYPLKQQPD